MSEITRYPEGENSHIIREVNIHEYYENIDGQVYWNWKLEYEDEFRHIALPFPEIPFAMFPTSDGRLIWN